MTIPHPATTIRKLLPAKQVWLRYGVCDRTIDRWVKDPDLGFPAPMVVNKRRYWVEDSLAQWERRRAARKA